MVVCKKPKVEKQRPVKNIAIIHIRHINGLESSVIGKDYEKWSDSVNIKPI